MAPMKTLATANYDFEGLITGGYADAYKADRRPVTLIGINFSARKRNIDEPVIEGVTT